MVATFDGSKQILYVDGSPIASNSVTGRAGGISSLIIGGGETLGFEGLLDEVRVYNRALTQEEVLALYQATSFDITPLPVPTVPTGFRSSATSSSPLS